MPALLTLVGEEPGPLRADGEGGEVRQERVEPPEPHLAHELQEEGYASNFNKHHGTDNGFKST